MLVRTHQDQVDVIGFAAVPAIVAHDFQRNVQALRGLLECRHRAILGIKGEQGVRTCGIERRSFATADALALYGPDQTMAALRPLLLRCTFRRRAARYVQ